MASSSKLNKNGVHPPSQPQPQAPSAPPHQQLSLKKPNTSINKHKTKLHNSLIPSSTINDDVLSTSSHLTRQELLRRRLQRIRRLSKVYRDHYWALMEDLRVHYREYYWKYGVSPCKVEDERESGGADREFGGCNVEGCGETNHNNSIDVFGGNGGGCGKLGLGFGENASELKLGGNNQCALVSCKLKAMALTSYCYLHILSDPQQKLYKACNFMIKIAQQGPILCGRPILKSTIPSLCNIHFPKAQKDVKHALKKAGLNVSSSSKLAPKFHVVIAEYVHQIQAKRRAAQKHKCKTVVVKEELPT
ncbi:uncharacterized protein LOC130825599 [Amaranthus tricolor]|uniref:uncharacterized protein LOC130825599 n=1 Tax=Amaranthus tricolor TaxID=29722 RepID=UPI0025837614|nr:uncharacterized protein LOC130825599 [Amaranthus tricolor]